MLGPSISNFFHPSSWNPDFEVPYLAVLDDLTESLCLERRDHHKSTPQNAQDPFIKSSHSNTLGMNISHLAEGVALVEEWLIDFSIFGLLAE